jgi:hypothetical protein
MGLCDVPDSGGLLGRGRVGVCRREVRWGEQFGTGIEHSKITGSYIDPARSQVTLGVFADRSGWKLRST